MAAHLKIVRGTRFIHSRLLNPKFDGTNLECLDTRVAGGVVYYRPNYGKHDDGTPWLGSAGKFPIEQWDKWVSSVL